MTRQVMYVRIVEKFPGTFHSAYYPVTRVNVLPGRVQIQGYWGQDGKRHQVTFDSNKYQIQIDLQDWVGPYSGRGF